MAMRQRKGAVKVDRAPTAQPPRSIAAHRGAAKHAHGRLVQLGAACAAVALALAVAAWLRSSPLPPHLRPFPGPKLAALPQFQGDHAQRMLWGTYRPGLYFGLRTRSPRSLLVGLMWVDPGKQDALGNIRHQAQQGDGLSKYGWLAHDGESYGRQELLDGRFNITTSWVQRDCSTASNDDPSDCVQGRDWGARITAQAAPPQPDAAADDDEYADDEEEPPAPQGPLSFILYVASEDGSAVELNAAAVAAALQPGASGGSSKGGVAARRAFSGNAAPVGPWALHLGGVSSAAGVHHVALHTPHLHNLTQAVRESFMRSLLSQQAAGAQRYALVLPNTVEPGANVAAVQITAMLPLTLDLTFLSGGDVEGTFPGGSTAEQAAVGQLSGAGLSRHLRESEAAFERRFAATFGSLDDASLPAGTAAAAKAALSNLLGGIGYWHGHSLVRVPQHVAKNRAKKAPTVMPMQADSLFSATPSRSFFPRGFLWDEGFHQLLVRRWAPAVSRDALAHWLDLMTAGGWIPREQILGAEAAARVPEEFVVQSPEAANPPTLFLSLAEMATAARERAAAAAAGGAEGEGAEGAADLEFLRAAWPRLQVWFRWYNSTQAGPVPGSYRWRGRDPAAGRELNPKTLTSGLDDFPRASHPSDEERHVDLRCWMALAARAMAAIGAAVGAPPAQVQPFAATAARLADFSELQALHWDALSGRFLDWGRHSEGVALVAPPGNPQGEPERVVTGAPPVPSFVPHYGYVSLFPLLMQLIPPHSPQLGQQLQLLRSPELLWTPHGLRSLSADSSLYQRHNTPHDPPYWRGAVWVNVNYLALRALREYAAREGPHAAQAGELARELRGALLRTLVGQYNARGYLWEQYDADSGQGKGSHPFTGWTALLALVAADEPAEA